MLLKINFAEVIKMTKFFYQIFLVLGIVILSMVAVGKIEAAPKTPLDNDKNFYYIDSHMGITSYLDLRTLNILKNDPPYFMISGKIVRYSIDKNKVHEIIEDTRFYDALSYRSYVKNKYTSGDWVKDNVKIYRARRYADVFFKAAFGRDFYSENFGIDKRRRYSHIKNIDYNQIALGGIQIGSDKNRVRSIYGNPDKIKEHDNRSSRRMYQGYIEKWTYGDSFEIVFINGIAEYIHSSGKNGIKTPDGIAVGDDIRKLYRTYGTAKRISSGKDGGSYIYRNDDNDVCMAFWVKDDKIIEIRILIE